MGRPAFIFSIKEIEQKTKLYFDEGWSFNVAATKAGVKSPRILNLSLQLSEEMRKMRDASSEKSRQRVRSKLL